MLLTAATNIIIRDNIQVLQINNAFATAEISLFGGHVLSFKPKHDDKERLWLSKNSLFDGKKAIRGGIPICWPWFGDHSSNTDVAAHGYVRTQTWQILNTEETELGTTLTLKPATSVGDGFEYDAQLVLIVHIGQQLSIQLHTTNLGNTAFTYNCALHTYFTISNIHQCELQGLSEQYADKTLGYQVFETPQPYRFIEETDRVHLQQPSTLTIIDAEHSKTEILSSGHDSIVVWNPWQHKSISMGDMADDGYLNMLCVETAITQGQNIAPRATHVLQQVIK